jgi:argininosuccinate lyase
MWKGRFSEETSDIVQNFTQSLDMDWCLAKYDIAGSIAHARMLGVIGILKDEEVTEIEKGLLRVKKEIEDGSFLPSIELEDVHMNIEQRLTEIIGPAGAKLHSGRSRNDQTATALRLFLRDRLVCLGEGIIELMNTILQRAQYHNGTIVPGYTHLQQAQPINVSPLGAGALAGSTLPIDREFTAHALGFDSITENSLDSVSSRDYLLDYHYFASRFILHCSRLSEDLVIYSSQEFGWLILPDQFCTGSSMMPQKKNPDVPELIRGKAGQITGNFLDLLFTLKGLPSTYNRDLQEDKKGLLASLKSMESVIRILPSLISKVEVDEGKTFRGSLSGLCLATDIAEYLVMIDVPFRESHWKVGRLVKWCLEQQKDLTELDYSEIKYHIPEVKEDVMDVISFQSAVSRRNVKGGTSPDSVRSQIDDGKVRLSAIKNDILDFKKNLFDHE